ncbi:CapA family protein [Cohnella hongkongensis]|uniref:CapA family protein n=1 Tax=Cohnella hongkongensis TaxID=178337 RepID=A0ABV9F7V1_9BACL
MTKAYKQRPSRSRFVVPLGAGLLALFLASCANDAPRELPSAPGTAAPGTQASAAPAGSPSPEASPQPPAEPEVREATLMAVGDIMVHMPQLPAYYDKPSDSYDLRPWFSQVMPVLEQGDWVVGNLETPIAGKDLKFTGFPRFNAPDELAEAIKYAGIQLVSTANNHSLDRGVPGVQRTLSTVRKIGLVPYGTSESEADRRRSVIEERNGIRMGFLAYTYGTNGIPIPAGKEYAVNLIDPDVIKREIAELREAGADVVTVSLHFGVEYQRMPNSDQTALAEELVKAGADLILGSHPHVVQPYEEIAVAAEESFDGAPRTGIVIYSLGNFISNQTGDWKDVGVIFSARVVKTVHPDGTAVIEWKEVTTEPTWVHIAWKNKHRHYTVIPLQRELEKPSFSELKPQDYKKMQKMQSGLHQHLRRLVAG